MSFRRVEKVLILYLPSDRLQGEPTKNLHPSNLREVTSFSASPSLTDLGQPSRCLKHALILIFWNREQFSLSNIGARFQRSEHPVVALSTTATMANDLWAWTAISRGPWPSGCVRNRSRRHCCLAPHVRTPNHHAPRNRCVTYLGCLGDCGGRRMAFHNGRTLPEGTYDQIVPTSYSE